jgi:hypothetical protein
LYLSARCGDWRGFDPAMLERMLFQADFLHFRSQGFPITGQTYRRGILTPGPRNMARILRGMVGKGELRILEEPLADGLHVRRIPKAGREANLRMFDGEEIALVEKVIRFYRVSGPEDGRENGGENGRECGNRSGPDLLALPWELAAPREEIPYSLALLGTLNGNGNLESRPWTSVAPGEGESDPLLARNPLILAA